MSELTAFLEMLYPDLTPAERIETRAIAPAGEAPIETRFHATREDAAAYIAGYALRRNLYIGVNARHGEDGTEAGVVKVRTLWCDADAGKFGGSKEAAFAALRGLDTPPTMIVDSGGGYHAYWKLRRTIDIATPTHKGALKSLMKRLYAALAPEGERLDSVQDLGRILRPPGTRNWKYITETPVQVVYHNPEVVYAIKDIEDALPPILTRPTPAYQTREAERREWTEQDVREMLAVLPPHDDYNSFWLPILMAVHSIFPDDRGVALIEEWSPGTVGEVEQKFRSFRRTGVTMGTLVHHARKHGWTPSRPQAGPGLRLIFKRGREEARRKDPSTLWKARLDATPELDPDDFPYVLNRFLRHIEPLNAPFPNNDWMTLATLTAWSALFPQVTFEQMGLNHWFLGVARSGAGKSRLAKELRNTLDLAASLRKDPFELFTSGSPQGMFKVLQGQNQSLFVYLDEMASFLAGLAADHQKSMKGDLCKLYDRDVYANRLVKDGVAAKDPYAVMLASTTPSALREHIERTDMLQGWMSRVWYCATDHQDVDVPPPDLDERRALAELINEQLATLKGVTRVAFDTHDGGKPLLLTTYEKEVLELNTGKSYPLEEDEDDAQTLPPGRDAARVRKTAALLELAENLPRIVEPQEPGGPRTLLVRERNVELAIAIVERARAYTLRLMGQLGQGADSRLTEKIERQLKRLPQTKRELVRNTNGSNRDVQACLTVLEEAGTIRPKQDGKRILYAHVAWLEEHGELAAEETA